MNVPRAIAFLTLVCLALLAPTAGLADEKGGEPWEAVSVGPGKIAVPKNWRSFDKIKPTMIVYRQGDGTGVRPSMRTVLRFKSA